jgi:hypothetical protein
LTLVVGEIARKYAKSPLANVLRKKVPNRELSTMQHASAPPPPSLDIRNANGTSRSDTRQMRGRAIASGGSAVVPLEDYRSERNSRPPPAQTRAALAPAESFRGSDEALRAEAQTTLAQSPALQVVCEMMGKLRVLNFDWWTPEFTRERWSAHARMRWYRDRPDLRQEITASLTGLPATTARHKTPEFQADLMAAVMEAGDVLAPRFEEAFDPRDLVVHGPVAEFWTSFRERMPWYDDSASHQAFIAWFLRALLAERTCAEEGSRRAILTALDVRASIDARVWQTYLPVDIRAAVDEARIRQERSRPRDAYLARHELAIAVPEHIAAHVPLTELTGIFTAAEQAMASEFSAVRTPSRPR